MTKKQRMEEAYQECLAYNRMGGLTEEMIEDIAHDHQVDAAKLKARYDDND